ncbi:sigma-70 family RNA polymerase sigma factor [Streptomyces cinnamoneus]
MHSTGNPAFAPSADADGAKALPAGRTRDEDISSTEAGGISITEAFEEFQRHQGFLRVRIRGCGVPDSAVDDVLSQVGENYAKRRQAGPVDYPMAYLARMAYAASYDYVWARRRKGEVLVGDDWDQLVPEIHERSTEDIVAESFLNEELLLKVKSLPLRQREVITLIYMAGLSYEAVAERCGMTVATVRRYHSRALYTLRELYEAVAPTAEEV